jgi:Zn-dependent protease
MACLGLEADYVIWTILGRFALGIRLCRRKRGMTQSARLQGPPPPPPPPSAFANHQEQIAPAASADVAAGQPMAKPLDIRFSVFGIPVAFNPSFLAVSAVLFYHSAFPLSMVASLIGVAIFSVLWHELGHAFGYRFFGHKPEIRLMGVFGLTCARTKRPIRPAEAVVITAAGPIAGFLLAGVCMGLNSLTTPAGSHGVLFYLVVMNLVLNTINLLPAVPLDGGRIMMSLLAMVAPRSGDKIGYGISILAAGAALLWALSQDDKIFALILLGIFSANFSAFRTVLTRRGAPAPQPA